MCGLPAIARAAGRSTAQAQADLARAITDGKLPGVFLSEDGGTVYFKEELFAADQARQAGAEADARRAEPWPDAAPLTPLEQFQRDGSDFLNYLKSCQGRLDDAADEETGRHAQKLRGHFGLYPQPPRPAGPGAPLLGLLPAHHPQAAGHGAGPGDAEAENARAIRRDITGILHTLNTAYVRLYDTLLQDVSMDVSTEIDTLEAMLRQDGLAGALPAISAPPADGQTPDHTISDRRAPGSLPGRRGIQERDEEHHGVSHLAAEAAG